MQECRFSAYRFSEPLRATKTYPVGHLNGGPIKLISGWISATAVVLTNGGNPNVDITHWSDALGQDFGGVDELVVKGFVLGRFRTYDSDWSYAKFKGRGSF